MNETILKDVTQIFQEVLDDNSLALTSETSAADIADWDSLTHIQLMVAVEKHFNIRFTAQQMRAFKNIGELCTTIETVGENK